ncbi:hypothetical protein [Acinetobacter sp.]|uniref:hypothetical protein n=1 Tax=Acinetobacter sp. TaxID=472 RepID=UPI003890BDD1
MRYDFNKQLTERERLGHKRKFGDIRNAKANKVLDEDMSGGKESIHTRRRHARNGGRKSFNENLNPLKNFLRESVGRPWDKVYSEITSTFDKRKVINNHILEHLFQYVELKVYIVDGKPCTLNTYRNSIEKYRPITAGNPNYPTYYVDPIDGIFKAPKQESHLHRRQREAEEAKKAGEKLRSIYHRLNEDTHLIRMNGIWWVYSAKAKPAQVAEYHLTPEWALTQPLMGSYMLKCAWNALPRAEKEKHGKLVMVDAPMSDKIEAPKVPGFYDGSWFTNGKYFFKRQAASHKQLKAAGVDGMIPKEEPKQMSHREASKYRK